jgi:hypothetical protein
MESSGLRSTHDLSLCNMHDLWESPQEMKIAAWLSHWETNGAIISRPTLRVKDIQKGGFICRLSNQVPVTEKSKRGERVQEGMIRRMTILGANLLSQVPGWSVPYRQSRSYLKKSLVKPDSPCSGWKAGSVSWPWPVYYREG